MRWAWLLATIGCGRLGFDDRSFDARPPDTAVDAAMCDPATAFGTPVQVPGVNDPTAYDSTFLATDDELTAYFYSNRGATDYDIYRATRPDRSAAWTVARVDELSSPSEEKEPSLSPDGKVLAFTSDRMPNTGGDDLWYATFDGAMFTVAGPISAFDTTGTDYHPTFQPDSDQFWFSSDISGTFAIYHAQHLGAGQFGPATLEADLSIAGTNSGAATPSADGLTMYFRSDRDSTPGDYDIYVATRASLGEPFGSATRLVEVNSTSLDTPNWISPDGCRLYLSSSREDASNIYVATKPL
ncbi:MAG: hypothetical protein QM831_03090 [Kofleriaceae bacterium]